MAQLFSKKWFKLAILSGCCAYVARRYFNGGECTFSRDLTNKTVIITGGNRGIGEETAINLAKSGARVIIACRGSGSAAEGKKSLPKNIEFRHLDLTDFTSVRQFAKEFTSNNEQLDILINNAGVYNPKFSLTKEGFESNFGVNHLGHFLLTNLLLDSLKKTPESRIINVSSIAHLRSPPLDLQTINQNESQAVQFDLYAQSKFANVLFTKQLALILDQQGSGSPKVVSLHPGVIWTTIFDGPIALIPGGKILSFLLYPIANIFFKDVFHGAQTTLTCALMPYQQLLSGGYYKDNVISKVNRLADNNKAGEELWSYSERAVKLQN